VAPFGNAKFLVRETLPAGSKNGLGASEHRGHTTALAQRGKVWRREKVTRHTHTPARRTRDEIAGPPGYLDCYRSDERTREKVWPCYETFIKAVCSNRGFDWHANELPVFCGDF